MIDTSKKACYIFLSTIFFVTYSFYMVATNYNFSTIYLQNNGNYYEGYGTSNYNDKYSSNNQNGFTWNPPENNTRNKSNPAAEYAYDKKMREEDIANKTNEALADAAKRAKQLQDAEDKRIKDEQTRRNNEEKKNQKIQEDARLKQQQSSPRLCFDNPRDLDPVNKNCTKQSTYKSENNEFNKRLVARANAIEQTRKQSYKCFDYYSQVKHPKFTDPYADVFNNCYGTALDKQLHEELCDTRISMMDLQTNYADNLQVRAFAPLIYQATAQAKIEKNAEKAFNLSDFSYDLVRIVSGGVRLIVLTINNPEIAARGIAIGVKTTCNPQHWVDMGMGILKFGALLADEYGRQDSSDNAFDYGTLTGGKYDLFLEKGRENDEYHRKIRQAIQQECHETLEKIKKMSDEELIEGIFSFGTTFMLDGVILKAASLATTIEGRALLNQCADALSSPFAKEYVLEVAGVGKLALGEGADITNMAIDIVEKNPKLLSEGKSITQVLYETAKDAKNLSKDVGTYNEICNAGSLIIEQGGKFSASEIRAAKYMQNLGKDVILRIPRGTRAGGSTSDLLVNGLNYDVYTPITNNPSRIISAIADKKTQAIGIVLDLSETTVTSEQLGDVMARLAGKGITSIKEVIIFK